MKRLMIMIMGLTFVIPCFAQMDIKSFNGKGKTGIVAILGEPIREDGYDNDDILIYPNRTIIAFDRTTKELTGFNTDSPNYCILSDDVQGGFKVGDKFSKVQAFDFVHSRYGKNRLGNALKLIDSTPERDYYGVYSEEWIHFGICVKNGIIIAIDMSTPEEYNGQDMTNKLW